MEKAASFRNVEWEMERFMINLFPTRSGTSGVSSRRHFFGPP
jgi:hypothetical protein